MTDNKFSLLFTGDLAMVGLAESTPDKPYQLKISREITDLFSEADISIVNLEAVLTESNDKIEKSGPHLKSHPESVQLLKSLNINIACLSNNHIRDFGNEGIADTIETCHSNNIKTVGSGMSSNEASMPLFVKANEKTIALLNFSESEYNTAGEDFAGSNPDDPIHIWRSIHEAKKQSDYQIVVMHGGKEMHPYPTPYQVEQFRFIAEQGVHAVVGHHSHVIGGYEIYKGIPLIYSLGNFIFDEAGNSAEWYKGVLAGISLDEKENIELEFYHVQQDDRSLKIIDKSVPNDGQKKKGFINTIDYDIVAMEWDKLSKKQSLATAKILLNLSLLKRALSKFGLYKLTDKDRRFLMALGNRYRCRSHRLFTIDAINNYLNISK